MLVRTLCLLSIVALACGDDDGTTDTMTGMDLGTSMDMGEAPAGGFDVLRSGTLSDVPDSPGASGFVGFGRNDDGQLIARLGADFAQGMGPGDTELRLAMSDENLGDQMAADASSVSDAIGIIPNGMTGELELVVPAGIMPSDFSHAVVWCPTAAINFGVAELGTVAGTFETIADTPGAEGSISIARNESGGITVTLGEDFSQGMGPGDTEIRLANGSGNVAEMLEEDASSVSPSVGIVPNGATGSMVFEASGVMASSFTHAIIWCPTAAINFAVAPIEAR